MQIKNKNFFFCSSLNMCNPRQLTSRVYFQLAIMFYVLPGVALPAELYWLFHTQALVSTLHTVSCEELKT